MSHVPLEHNILEISMEGNLAGVCERLNELSLDGWTVLQVERTTRKGPDERMTPVCLAWVTRPVRRVLVAGDDGFMMPELGRN